MSGPAKRKTLARNVGAGTIVIAAVAVTVVWYGLHADWWREQCLVLATVKDATKLELGSPVYFRGVHIGQVVQIRPPSADLPGYKLRMAVDPVAFQHIPLDSMVRIDPGKMNLPTQVTILPGLDKPDWEYPGSVKPLREVTETQETLRLLQDVLEGLANASQAQAAQASAQQLKDEVAKLRAELERMRKQEQGEASKEKE